MYIPTVEQLQGYSIENAECLGKPHVGASYLYRDRIDKYIMDEDCTCAICGKLATNVHHQPFRSHGKGIIINGKLLRPSLFALCGSGTTGCHGKIHNGTIKIKWKWVDENYAKRFWEGSLFEYAPPHSELLYEFGYWDFIDNQKDHKHLSDYHIYF